MFAWDDPLPGGFPGKDSGCRCYAEPVISPDTCSPKTGLTLQADIETAALAGYAEAAKGFGIELLQGLIDLASIVFETVDYGISELTVLLGIAREERQAEVARVRE